MDDDKRLVEGLNQSLDDQTDSHNKETRGRLDRKQIYFLERFLEKVKNETYPEPVTELHANITNRMFEYFMGKCPLSSESRILDIGCGQGVALTLFKEKGFKPIGIALNDEDVAVCKQKGYEVFQMDQSFLEFDDNQFDLVWCRHCIEHSIFPFFTLSGFHRVLKPKGYLYIEVPAPETSCRHQTNKNHYSVLGKSMWAELISRTGFNLLETVDVSFEVKAGPDVYWAYIQQKP